MSGSPKQWTVLILRDPDFEHYTYSHPFLLRDQSTITWTHYFLVISYQVQPCTTIQNSNFSASLFLKPQLLLLLVVVVFHFALFLGVRSTSSNLVGVHFAKYFTIVKITISFRLWHQFHADPYFTFLLRKFSNFGSNISICQDRLDYSKRTTPKLSGL